MHSVECFKIICVSYVFFYAEFKFVIRIALPPTVFMWQNFLKCNFRKFRFFVTLPVTFKIGWCALLYISKCGHENLITRKTVSMWAQSQTARMSKLRHVLTSWDMKLTVSSAWGTQHCYWCTGMCFEKMQVLSVLFKEVFCVTGLCLLYFHHAKEVFKSSWHLLLHVWLTNLQIPAAKLYPTHKKC